VELADHAHPPAEDVTAAFERSSRVRGLVADVGRLPDTQRSALVLRELEGRSYADIADELDVTVPAVKSLLVRARQGLKRARDDRRVAAWLPLPLLSRLVERVGTLWEPVAASATPKVACAAVVVAGSLPVVSGTTPATPPTQTPTKPHGATAAVVHRTAPAATAPTTTPPPAKTARSSRPSIPTGHDASTSATKIPDGLRADCADGTIDERWPQATLNAAIARSSSWSGEYGSCRQALLQASLGS
jgi:hypothetical protein